MHARALRRTAILAAVVWLMTIISAELLHAAIESDSQAAQRECPLCLFHSTHGQAQPPEAALQLMLRLTLTASLPLPAYARFSPDSHPAFHRSIRAPPAL
ncbi:MAG: hypothetical protein KatS3mg017_0453 [Fimbriimonadales bacterium]|nr:MAG: hypothetical protein KatS3mg017_0453 [Fimbriimonadales bacterium]